jgi:phage-related protein
VKLALFHPQAREVIKTFPEAVRKELGKAILDLQKGHTLEMPLSRPMPTVASGVEELRMRDVLESIEPFISRSHCGGF